MKTLAIVVVAIAALAAGIPLLAFFAWGPPTLEFGGGVRILATSTSGVAPQSMVGKVLRDVTYCKAGGVSLQMDLYFPTTVSVTPFPVAVYVHGGGWVSGDKRSGEGILDASTLLARGYLVASVNYRLAPRYKFPAQIEDVKCAIRFLRANAAIYGLDPGHMGAWGGSAGGHLVSLLGVTDTSAGWDVGEYLDKSSRVQAVVDYFGPADLTAPDFATGRGLRTLEQVFESKDMLATASPVNYISPDDPPFLIMQGEKDNLVPPSQSQEFYERLRSGGVTAALVMVKNAGHGFSPVGGPISPSRTQITQMMADFFDAHLKDPNSTTYSALTSVAGWALATVGELHVDEPRSERR